MFNWDDLGCLHTRDKCFVLCPPLLFAAGQLSKLSSVPGHTCVCTQFNIVGGGIHQVGLQTENSQEERKRRRNTCLWLLQVRASLHWCMESTSLLYLFFYHLTSFLLQQLMCAAIFLTWGSYMKHSSSFLQPRHSYSHTSCGLCPRPSFHPDSATNSEPCLSTACLSSCLSK